MRPPYLKQPRRGDVLESGRYGPVVVCGVHQHGLVLDVQVVGSERHERLERAPEGHWFRLSRSATV